MGSTKTDLGSVWSAPGPGRQAQMGTVTLPCLFVTEKLDAGPPGRGRPPAPLISSKPHLEKSKIFFGAVSAVRASDTSFYLKAASMYSLSRAEMSMVRNPLALNDIVILLLLLEAVQTARPLTAAVRIFCPPAIRVSRPPG